MLKSKSLPSPPVPYYSYVDAVNVPRRVQLFRNYTEIITFASYNNYFEYSMNSY